MQSISRILCPVDFSESSARAIVLAETLARGLSAEIVLFHVFDTAQDYTKAGQTHPVDAHLQEKLDTVLVGVNDIPIRRCMHIGPAGEAICWFAESEQCDMIVMGTHGRTGLSHLLFGSIAEYVMRHARCPVVTVRERPMLDEPLQEPLARPIPPPRFM
jgi:universal stress protein A